jgi:hypothetical protein
MREAIYNTYLWDSYSRLASLEKVLEVPLDCYVAGELLREPGAADQGAALGRYHPINSRGEPTL